MIILKYFIKTPIVDMKRDFNEYISLRKNERNAYNRYQDAYEGLVVDLGEQNYDATVSTEGCIVECVQVYNDMWCDSCPDVRFCRSECAQFNVNTPCNNSECPYELCNSRFFMLKEKYDIIKNKRKNFWKNKFNEKQR